MAKSAHPKKKRITHIASMSSDSNFESEGGGMLSGCFDYVHSIMKEMDTGIKSVDCNNFYRQDVMNPSTQNNKEQKHVAPYSNDCSQNIKNAVSKFKLTAMRKFPLMEKSQKVLKQLKHNRSIPKQRAHLAVIPESPGQRNKKTGYASEFLEKKENRNAELKKRVLAKKGSCSKKTASYPPTQNSKNPSKNVPPCSVHNSIQNRKGNINNKSNAKYSSIKEKSISSACSKINISHSAIKKRNNKTTNHKIDSQIQPHSIKKSVDSHFVNETPETKDDATDSDEFERFVQNNKTTAKPKKKAQKRKMSKWKKKTKSIIFQPEQYDSNCSTVLSDSDEDILKKQKKNHKMTTKLLISSESETNLSVLKETESDIFQSEQYDSNCRDDSSDSDYNERISKKQKSNHEMVINPLKSTNDKSETNLSENPGISTSNQVGENTIQENYLNLQGSNLKNMPCSSESENLCQRESCKEDMPSTPHEDLVKKGDNSFNHDTYSKNFPSKVVEMNKEISINSFQNQLGQININSTSDFNKAVTYTNFHNELKSECSVLIDLSSSDTEAENVKSYLVSSARPLEENNKLVSLKNVKLDSDDSDLEVIEVVSAPNRKGENNTCNKLGSVDCLGDSNKCSKIETAVKSSLVSKYSQTVVNKHLSENISDKKFESVLPSEENNATFHPLNLSNILLNERQIKKENVQNHSAVYVTNMCENFDNVDSNIKDELFNSITGQDCMINQNISNIHCKSETSFSKSHFDDSTVLCEDDDVIIIDSVKSNERSKAQAIEKESCDDDIIIDAVVKCQNSDIKPIISTVSSNSQIENCTVVKKELNPKNVLNCSISHLESLQKNIFPANRSENTNAQNTSWYKHLESGIKNECSTIWPNIDVQNNSSLIEKEIALDEGNSANLNVLHLLDMFKRELNVYREIVQTEEHVGANLKLVEAHQAEKIKLISSLIKHSNSDNKYYKIYRDSLSLKSKEQKNDLYDNIKSSTSLTNRVQSTESCIVDASKISKVSISQDFSSIVSLDVSPPCIQDISSVSSTTEIDVKPDVSKLIKPEIQQTYENFRSKIGFMENSPYTLKNNATTRHSDLQSEEKQAMKLFFGEKCCVCGNKAVAACQGCAKVFFCSHKCGKKFWDDGHENACGN